MDMIDNPIAKSLYEAHKRAIMFLPATNFD